MGRGRTAGVRAAISSSFGFGGTGTVLVFEREDARTKVKPSRRGSRLAVTAVATIGSKGIVVGAGNVLAFSPAPGPAAPPLAELAPALVDPARSRRFDAHASLVSAGSAAVVESAGLSPAETGLVAGTAFGNVERTVSFLRIAFEKGPRRAPPAEFPHLLPSSASGNASIYLGLTGPVLSTGDLDASADAALSLACDWLDAGFAPAMVVVGAEPADAFVRDVLGPACEDDQRVRRGEGAAWVALEREDAARTRGAKVHAVVAERVHARASSIEGRTVAAPSKPERAFVVCDHSNDSIERFLARSGWGAVPRRSVERYAGFHEGLGGVAFSAAVAAISGGDVDEVLLVGRSAVRVYAFLLRKPA
jgi:3-oxoacyl-(acyl-carrier-protein) synthase